MMPYAGEQSNCPAHLRSLTLAEQEIGADYLDELCRSHIGLRELSLLQCSLRADASLTAVLSLAHLRGLHASGVAANARDLHQLVAMPSLRTLVLRGPQVDCLGFAAQLNSQHSAANERQRNLCRLLALDVGGCSGSDSDLAVCASTLSMRSVCTRAAVCALWLACS